MICESSACVEVANEDGTNEINMDVYGKVLAKIHNGTAFPSLETRYKRAVGESDGRAVILTLLAEQNAELNDHQGRVVFKEIRTTVQDLDVEYIDQLIPRLVDRNYGPALIKVEDARGTYEFADPVLRAYVKLRR